jgi:ABC-type transport system involved in cytochrome bd biosynthesis fused ATPase/permease subunit
MEVRTLWIVTHWLATVLATDRIHVVKEVRTVESGDAR